MENNPLRYVDPSEQLAEWVAVLLATIIGSGLVAFTVELFKGGSSKEAAIEGLGAAGGAALTGTLLALAGPTTGFINIGLANAAGSAFADMIVSSINNDQLLTPEFAASIISSVAGQIRNDELSLFLDLLISSLRTYLE
ncbi:hypothetical protein NST84_06910 [Paenibacillus sp. FSL R7-0345]|uniref:hypothetical protein n=1 Tax=Paenibacillus sp. FSL R7-0345 TaxID=2954535 RepID=UPI00315A0A84